jgi:hypothetical protein
LWSRIERGLGPQRSALRPGGFTLRALKTVFAGTGIAATAALLAVVALVAVPAARDSASANVSRTVDELARTSRAVLAAESYTQEHAAALRLRIEAVHTRLTDGSATAGLDGEQRAHIARVVAQTYDDLGERAAIVEDSSVWGPLSIVYTQALTLSPPARPLEATSPPMTQDPGATARAVVPTQGVPTAAPALSPADVTNTPRPTASATPRPAATDEPLPSPRYSVAAVRGAEQTTDVPPAGAVRWRVRQDGDLEVIGVVGSSGWSYVTEESDGSEIRVRFTGPTTVRFTAEREDTRIQVEIEQDRADE